MNARIVHIIVLVLTCCSNTFSQKINPERLSALLEEGEHFHSDAVIIYQGDSLITETYFGTGNPDNLIELMSCTKSIVSLAVISLLDDQLLDSIEVPVHTFYPEWNQGIKKNITLEHLLTMTSGLQDYRTTDIEIYPSPDVIELALRADLIENPGEKFRYGNKAVNLVSGIIWKVSGKRMDQYIQERLFDPLDIQEATWDFDSVGNPMSMSGCKLRPADFIKIGLLIAGEGFYNGRMIISSENLKKIITPSAKNPEYGLLWWLTYDQEETLFKEEIIQELKRLGASQGSLSLLDLLLRKYMSDPEHYYEYKPQILQKWQHLVRLLGPNQLAELYENTFPENQLTRRVFKGPVRAISAKGWLGNYLVIEPETNLVGLRMIDYRNFRQQGKSGEGPDNFYEFEKRLLDLVEE